MLMIVMIKSKTQYYFMLIKMIRFVSKALMLTFSPGRPISPIERYSNATSNIWAR